MSSVAKTVFLSYRRTNRRLALAIFQYLRARGYDVFFDYNRSGARHFEDVILNNIASRAHFLLLLTPSASVNMHGSGDWMQSELEHAIATERHIVPIMLETGRWDADNVLTNRPEILQPYRVLRVQAGYFAEAMTRLCGRYLDAEYVVSLHAQNDAADRMARNIQKFAQIQKSVSQAVVNDEVCAEERFTHGYDIVSFDDKESAFTEAITLNPDFVEAYHKRGVARFKQGTLSRALTDYNRAITIEARYVPAYVDRGVLHHTQGDFAKALADYNRAIDLDAHSVVAHINRGNLHQADGASELALADYNEAICLNPDAAQAYNSRGILRATQGDFAGALADYDKAIALKADYADAYNNRGILRHMQGELAEALEDYNRAIDEGAYHALAYYNRAKLYAVQENIAGAIADYYQYLRLNEDDYYGNQADVEETIRDLESRL